jgi:hypothetical protein
MRRVFADFNAETESGHFRLGFRGSQEDLRDQGAKVGDWIWLSDGELVLGAQLATDDRYGLVGVPRRETLVHLDDDDVNDIPGRWGEFLALSRKPNRSFQEEARVFQVLTILEFNAPPEFKAALPPGYLALRRAGALRFLGETELAMVELAEAIRDRTDDLAPSPVLVDLAGVTP